MWFGSEQSTSPCLMLLLRFWRASGWGTSELDGMFQCTAFLIGLCGCFSTAPRLRDVA